MRSRRGLSLSETLMGASLLTTILTLTTQVLLPCMTGWQLSQARAALEQCALVNARRVQHEVRHTAASSVTVSTSNPPALAFMSCDTGGQMAPYDATSGKPMWRRFVIYYLDSGNRVLYRKEWPNPALGVQIPALPYLFPTRTPAALTSAELLSICSTTNGTEKTVGYNVASFATAVDASGLVAMTVGLSDVVAQQTLYVTRTTATQAGE